LRWNHPNRGLVSPSVLIPLAEHSGLIGEVGTWVLEQAWSDRHRWQSQRALDLPVSVNVSVHQFMSAGFVDEVAGVLDAAETDPGLLTLEVTESVFIRDGDRALIVLNDLKNLGVILALDDFGTGYSSLSHLMTYPVDTIKLDQTFIANLGRVPASRTILTAVIQLAHGLGMTVVAEGVETSEQHRHLTELNCGSCQGFYFARPMSSCRLDTLIQDRADGSTPRLPALANT
jgi:EAL domain-containing protein (putative c-di-GMP-specific phosphodiesterase class I)